MIIDTDYPNSSPKIYCISNFAFPSLYDQRDLLLSILGREWKNKDFLENIIDSLPDFIQRIHENNLHKNLLFYGNYELNHIYEINNFLLNNDLGFFKCFQLMKPLNSNKSENSEKLIKKERFIILTDIYFLLFDPAPNHKNMGKLIFFGDIRQINITKTDVYHENENAHSYHLFWNKEDKNILSFQILFCNAFINTSISINPIQDFIDSLNRKSEKLKENFKVFQEDYKKPIDFLIKKESDLENLVNLVKYYDNKFSMIKNGFIAKNQVNYYEILQEYYIRIKNNNKAEEYSSKIKYMKEFRDLPLDNKNLNNENYDVVYNITNNYGLSRSYSNTYNEIYN